MRVHKWLTAAAVAVGIVTSGPAADLHAQTDTTTIEELERRIDAVTRELERLRLGRDVVEADTAMVGLGPAASKVYRVNQGVSLGGYGEFLYENYARDRENGVPSGATDRLDALRAILYVGYKFNDRLLFNSEIEVEHADEIYLEFAYIDYLLTDQVGIRAGMMLTPMGLVNELHEPPVFLGTERPVTEQVIIPTTWRENGIGLFGGNENVSWRVYLMNSLNGANFNASGLRGGRQKGSKALADDMAVTGRFDYTGTPGLLVGVSGYTGETTHGGELDGREVGGRVTIWDAHLDYKARGWDFRALVARATLGSAADLNRVNGRSGDDGVGESLVGWYVQGGYDILRSAAVDHQLIPYVRYERVNTHDAVPAGFTVDPGTDRTIVSLGAAWKPIPQVVAKIDYQMHGNQAETGVNQWNVQLGWLF